MTTVQTIQAEIHALEQQKAALETEYKDTEYALANAKTLNTEAIGKLPTIQATIDIIKKRLGILKQDKAHSELDETFAQWELLLKQSSEFYTAYAAKKEKIEQLQKQLNDLVAESANEKNLHYQTVTLQRQKLYKVLLKSPEHKDKMKSIQKKYSVEGYL